ncbi:hypothetical protein [Palleronia caenipelagi]|uniref:Methyltransferase n=1 Tax=Palleronia caenipelagi TaxID=2489174 RepID=A0A547PS34_9RHOB|nr:hypothetical protein [Palleronia caenipelagi]TRD16945.1 hypothetical protein FEV53_13480 [Palleronia caenipelagi]
MGKRSAYPRRRLDCYDTPPEAVVPLIGHLAPGVRYWEPCAGSGALLTALAGHAMCVGATDIEPRSRLVRRAAAEALTARRIAKAGPETFITNPPYPSNGSKGEPTLGLIRHLAAILPTWMLLPFDFTANQYFASVAPICAKILPIGRVSWMFNGKGGNENSAWVLFDAAHVGPTRFFARQHCERRVCHGV